MPQPLNPAEPALADRLAINELVARFDDAVNRIDLAEFTALWTEDAVWEIGPPRPLRIAGRDAIAETWRNMMSQTQWLFRGSYQGLLRIEGDGARGRWPCAETGVFASGESYDNRALYQDVYRRTTAGWRFQQRSYHYVWLSGERLPGAAAPRRTELPAV